jgi:hypothetical protein
MRVPPHSAWFVIANASGLALFVHFVLKIERTIRLEERSGPDFGDSLNFLLTAAPVAAIVLLLNAAWAVFAVLAYIRGRRTGAAIALSLVTACWVVTVAVLRGFS